MKTFISTAQNAACAFRIAPPKQYRMKGKTPGRAISSSTWFLKRANPDMAAENVKSRYHAKAAFRED